MGTDGQSINALIVFGENGPVGNQFVPVLCDAIRMAGINARYSRKDFWESDTMYDIIHFQWPEEVVGWNCETPDVIRRLKERIAFFRSRGTRFIYTRHSRLPRYANDIISRAYDIIESESDVVVHMGQCSRTEFMKKYPESRNIIIPHHIYQYTYREDISVECARQYLRLPQDAFIVTAFGKFRHREERRMVAGAFLRWDRENKLLVAPRFYPFSKRGKYGRNFLKRWLSRPGYYLLMPLLNRLLKFRAGAGDEPVDSCDLPYYMTASDVIFIQRKEALNSGNLPLGFLYHKVVVGPATGNIGEILAATGNPTFHPDNPEEIPEALEQARKLCARQQGETNYAYAMQHMNIRKIGKEYAQVYKDAIGVRMPQNASVILK